MEGANEFAAWIGRRETCHDEMSSSAARSVAAMVDDPTEFAAGAALPPLWHWFYFLPRAPQAQLDVDGHPRRGGFMPPLPYPRRMFAGARLTFLRPLRIGTPARRVGEIRDIEIKSGRSGKLAFVSVLYKFFQDEQLCVEEEQDIVYRQPGPPLAAPPVIDWEPLPPGAWSRLVVPDPRLLFRFSALTFNAHRIHYDRAYAIGEEGYPGLVVHGPLTAFLLIELVRQHGAQPIQFAFRGEAPLFDLAPFRVVGVPDNDYLALYAQGPDGKKAMTASAQIFSA